MQGNAFEPASDIGGEMRGVGEKCAAREVLKFLPASWNTMKLQFAGPSQKGQRPKRESPRQNDQQQILGR